MPKIALTTDLLCAEARTFSGIVSNSPEPALYRSTDGKAVGTHLEHKFRRYLQERYTYAEGNFMTNKPEQGYLTISNALQWRLQYSRIIEKAGEESGIRSVYKGTNP